MSFVVLTCPGCRKKILMDETDGKGFCMYCGNPVDAAQTSAEMLDPTSESYLDVIINGVEDTRGSEPWYPLIEGAVEDVKTGDMESAVAKLLSALQGQDPEVQNGMKDAMAEALVQWILRTVYDGGVYGGGLMAVAPFLVVDGMEDTSPSVLIEGIIEAIGSSGGMVSSPDQAYNMAASAYTLVAEYFMTEPGLDRQNGILEEFIYQCDQFSDIASEFGDEGEVCQSIGVMSSAAHCLNGVLREAVDELGEGRLDELRGFWEDNDVQDVGAIAAELLTRIYDEAFDDSEAFWGAMKDGAAGYVAAYTAPCLE